MSYLTVKALHIIGFTAWFAGLFYIVRLFVYISEAQTKPATERDILIPQLQLMARRLWFGITWPAMIGTVGFGVWLLVRYNQFQLGWVHLKLALVAGLVGYHFWCGNLRRGLQNGKCKWKSDTFRVFNEIATLFLVAIVFVAVQKTLLDTAWALGGFACFAVLLTLAVRIYRRIRLARAESPTR